MSHFFLHHLILMFVVSWTLNILNVGWNVGWIHCQWSNFFSTGFLAMKLKCIKNGVHKSFLCQIKICKYRASWKYQFTAFQSNMTSFLGGVGWEKCQFQDVLQRPVSVTNGAERCWVPVKSFPVVSMVASQHCPSNWISFWPNAPPTKASVSEYCFRSHFLV